MWLSQMSNLLVNPLPKKDKFGRTVRTDFRYWVNFARALDDTSFDGETRTLLALSSVYVSIDRSRLSEYIEGALDFFYCGQEQTKKDGVRPTERIIDYDIDASRIVVSFQQQYNIRLLSTSMHWWEFQTLLQGLNDQTIMGAVMQARAAIITPNMSKHEREHIMKLKKAFSLRRVGEQSVAMTEEEFIKNAEERAAKIRKQRLKKSQ